MKLMENEKGESFCRKRYWKHNLNQFARIGDFMRYQSKPIGENIEEFSGHHYAIKKEV